MNKKKAHLIFLLILSCWSISAFASDFEPENIEGKEIEKVQVLIESTNQSPTIDEQITRSFRSKARNKFSQVNLNSDLRKLELKYDKVEPSFELIDGKIQIIIRVWEGPPIEKIEWEGNREISTSRLEKILSIQPGTAFNRTIFNAHFRNLENYYFKKGYYKVGLQYEIKKDQDTGEAFIQIYINEREKGIISQIIFEGVNDQEEKAIHLGMETKEESILSALNGDGIFYPDKIAHDKHFITSFFQSRGYANPEVSLEIDPLKAEEGKLRLIIKVNKGELFHFGKIEFTGNALLTNEQIESKIKIYEGEVCSLENVKKINNAIQMLYGSFGYKYALVRPELDWVIDKKICNVKFQINEGGIYKIGSIYVEGANLTQKRRILRQSLLHPGEIFDLSKMQQMQTNLKETGYFTSVDIYTAQPAIDKEEENNITDIYISVEEAPTASASLSVGFISDIGASAAIELKENNFNIAGIPRIFSEGISALRGGGESICMNATFGSKQRVYTLSWSDPQFNDSKWEVGFGVNKSHSGVESDSYHIDTTEFSTFASYPLNPYWTFQTDYRLNSSRFFSRSNLIKDDVRSGLVSAGKALLIFDSVKSDRQSRNGMNSIFESEYAGLGGNYTFIKLGQFNTFYKTAIPKGIFKARLNLRYIVPVFKLSNADDIPISERFFLGGSSNVRGFKDYQIGPKLADTKEPAGGISSTFISLEYLQSIVPFVDLFAFCDAGSVCSKIFTTDLLRISAGFGASVTLMGNVAMQIGYGMPIQKAEDDKLEELFFSVGANF